MPYNSYKKCDDDYGQKYPKSDIGIQKNFCHLVKNLFNKLTLTLKLGLSGKVEQGCSRYVPQIYKAFSLCIL